MSDLISKLPNVGTTIFTVMSKMAAEHNAINLSQGFPNFPVAEELKAEYKKVIDRTIDIENEVIITAGATQAIFTGIQAVVNKGEEVIVLDPSYDCYAPSVELAGGVPIHVNLNSDFSVDWNKVEDVISKNTKLLVVNNPHNPGGTVFSKKDIEALEQIMDRHPHLYLLSDEVYEFIHFEQPHISVHTREKLINRSLIISSFGKTFHVTGWKIGYLVAPEPIMKEIKKIHQYVVFCVNSTAQAAQANYLPKADLDELGAFYMEKRDLFKKLMKNSRFELLDCQGSYFQVAKYNEISDLSDVDFSIELTQKHGVAVIPISGFNKDKHDDKLIRFCFAKDEETILKATEKLCKI